MTAGADSTMQAPRDARCLHGSLRRSDAENKRAAPHVAALLLLLSETTRVQGNWTHGQSPASKVRPPSSQFKGRTEAKSALHVASMLHGVAGRPWQSLKRKENRCDMMQHELRSA